MLAPFCKPVTGQGFSLIELLTAVAIIGLISAFAIPSYVQNSREAHRTEAQSTLEIAIQAMERCFTEAGDYTNSACPTTTELGNIGEGYYTYAITASASIYTITATANSAMQQDKDTDCIKMSVYSTGADPSAKDSSGNPSTVCWK